MKRATFWTDTDMRRIRDQVAERASDAADALVAHDAEMNALEADGAPSSLLLTMLDQRETLERKSRYERNRYAQLVESERERERASQALQTRIAERQQRERQEYAQMREQREREREANARARTKILSGFH